MSLFSRMMDKILHRKPKTEAPVVAAPVAPKVAPAAPTAAAPAVSAPAPVSPMQDVDVAAILNEMASENPQKLNWRTSIVDLMKLLDMDSSLSERKELAMELSYGGNMNDSASMNIWLHSAVLRKLAENGGKVPAEFLD
jgi:Domain of unknown function (DUF3597)